MLRLIAEHHRSDVHSFQWREFGVRGLRVELMALPNFYVRLGAHGQPMAELSIDGDGARLFWSVRLSDHLEHRTAGFLWPWRR